VLADLIVPSGVVVTAGLDGRIRSVSGVMDTGYFAPSPKREFVADHH
jgi:hypothetical protein